MSLEGGREGRGGEGRGGEGGRRGMTVIHILLAPYFPYLPCLSDQEKTSAGSILDISKYRDTCERSISILGKEGRKEHIYLTKRQ